MLAPWLIEKLREEERAREEEDRASWGRQLSIEADEPFLRPPPSTPPVERTEGGIVTIDFGIDFSV